MKNVHPNVLEAIGNTPLIKLNKLVGSNDATVYVKCEFMNPGGSIKDRMAVHMINKAERAGKLKPGGTIVENTSGNTGMGLALTAAVKGYKAMFTMPDKMSTEKINRLKALGATVVVTPTNVPAEDPRSYYETAKRLARETPGAFYPNQYHSEDNIEAHYLSTAPEIWEQLNGQIDCFVSGLGTGGTMSGVGKFLKEKNPSIRNVGVDPEGSVYAEYFRSGKLGTPHVYKVEGIGEDMLCAAMNFKVLDDVRTVTDKESFIAARRLAREEGIFGGGSSGSAVHVAIQMAKELGKGKTIVTVLPDSGSSYISKFYNDEWMRDNGFVEEKDLGTVADVLKGRSRSLVTAKPANTVKEIIESFKKHGISQMPIVQSNGAAMGMIHEYDVLNGLIRGSHSMTDTIEKLATPMQGMVTTQTPIGKLREIFSQENVAVVHEDGNIVTVLTKIDLIDHLARS